MYIRCGFHMTRVAQSDYTNTQAITIEAIAVEAIPMKGITI